MNICPKQSIALGRCHEGERDGGDDGEDLCGGDGLGAVAVIGVFAVTAAIRDGEAFSEFGRYFCKINGIFDEKISCLEPQLTERISLLFYSQIY